MREDLYTPPAAPRRRRVARAAVIVAMVAAAMNLLPLTPAKACDVLTLRGTGCVQSIRCLPATVGEPCL